LLPGMSRVCTPVVPPSVSSCATPRVSSVTLYVPSRTMQTSSVLVGAPEGDQFPPMLQNPSAAAAHDLVHAADAGWTPSATAPAKNAGKATTTAEMRRVPRFLSEDNAANIAISISWETGGFDGTQCSPMIFSYSRAPCDCNKEISSVKLILADQPRLR